MPLQSPQIAFPSAIQSKFPKPRLTSRSLQRAQPVPDTILRKQNYRFHVAGRGTCIHTIMPRLERELSPDRGEIIVSNAARRNAQREGRPVTGSCLTGTGGPPAIEPIGRHLCGACPFTLLRRIRPCAVRFTGRVEARLIFFNAISAF